MAGGCLRSSGDPAKSEPCVRTDRQGGAGQVRSGTEFESWK